MSKTVVLRPRLNEKTYSLATQRVYVFSVDGQVNKHLIARSVEDQFDVKVKSVNTLNAKGKPKRTISLSGKRVSYRPGKRSDIKTAYVTLKEGFSLPFFEAIEEEDKQQAATQAKIDKAVETKEKKETKPKKGLLKRAKKSQES